MKTPIFFILTLLFSSRVWASPITGKEFTIIAGGGDLDPQATSALIEKSGGKNAKILVITWAAEADPDRSARLISEDLKRHPLQSLDYSIHPPTTAAEAEQFLKQLGNADGIFFSGGKQRRIAKVFDTFPEVKKQVLARYHDGMPVMGTSAGTAMQSSIMIADTDHPRKAPPTETGLGLVPDDLILDTHFYPRHRWNRMTPLIEIHPGMMGIGVDEDGAAIVRGMKTLEVVGKHNVMIFDGKKIYELNPGDELNLETRVPIHRLPHLLRQCLQFPR